MKRVGGKYLRAKEKRKPITAKELALILIGAVIDFLVGLLLMLVGKLLDI